MSPNDVNTHTKWMLLFSGVFVIAALGFTALFGSVGFILANCVNMLVRTIKSIRFIRGYFGWSPQNPRTSTSTNIIYPGTSPNPFTRHFLHPAVVCSFLGALCVTLASERFLCCHSGVFFLGVHVAVGAVCLAGICLIFFFKERGFLLRIRGLFRGRVE